MSESPFIGNLPVINSTPPPLQGAGTVDQRLGLSPGQSAKPLLSLAVGQTNGQTARRATLEALRIGYRAVDTAAVYNNESDVGQALREAHDLLGLAREDLFITAKLWNNRQGLDSAFKACRRTLSRLGLDYVDLYLIHWPAPGQGRYVEAWKGLLKLRKEGLTRAVGVCNFLPGHIDRLMEETGEKPVVNQIELHPYYQQPELCAELARRGVTACALSPLGRGRALAAPLFRKLALKHTKTPAQIILRWHLERGRPVAPNSTHPVRIQENFDVFDFRLDPEDMRQIALLESGLRLGPDPATFV